MSASILVVEDERIVAKDLEHSLTHLGYTVTAVVSSGEEAIRHAQRHPPHLVLMDIRLSGAMDGIEAAAEIRVRLNLPVVYLTAYADAETVQRAKLTEPFGYLLKPFEERELQTAIEMALYKHRSERALQESHQWLETTLRSIGEAVVATDGAGAVRFLNPVAERLTGWAQAEAVGRGVGEVLALVEEGSGSVIESPVSVALREDRVVGLSPRTLLLGRSGGSVPISDSAAPIRTAGGQVLGAVLVFQDITQRKHLEAQLMHAQKMESIGRLAGGIAHDFNNLLTAILGYLELAEEEIPSEGMLHSYIDTIRYAAQRAVNLTGQLLAFARKQVVEPKILDLNEQVIALSKILRRLIGTNIELVMVSSADLWKVKADPGQIEQVIINLAVNARDAMPQGGNLILETSNVTLDNAEIALHVEASPGEYVMLRISDTGVGMDATLQQHIFDPFFTTKEAGKGTGLGLATCHGIIKQSGGHIALDSEPGRGTTFRIYLPRVQDAVTVTPAPKEISTPRGVETILVVDDEPVVRAMATRALQAQGYTVLEASSGGEALVSAVEYPDEIQLLVTDLVMPHMSGRQLAERLRSVRPGIKILYTSGYMDDTINPQGMFNDSAFLPKPYTLGNLGYKVREVLDSPSDKDDG